MMNILRKLAFPSMIVGVVLLIGWVSYANNVAVEQLKSEGKDYSVGLTDAPASGKNGKSAYDIAVQNGFKGTETDWLLSLVVLSPRGNQGDQGEKGDQGISAYQIAVLQGYTGSEQQWIASLKGETGSAGLNGSSTNGINGNDGAPGANGGTPEIRCEPETRMIQWRYTTEDEFAWRNLYEVVQCYSPPVEPVI